MVLASAMAARAQQPDQPKVKVNMLNVCSPSPEDKQEIASALSRIPKQPLFGADFEIDRGRTTLDQPPAFLQAGESAQVSSENAVSSWVRIRREFSVQALFSTVQYSFSVDNRLMSEILVLRVRDPKDLMQLSIEDSASAVASPAAMLATSTPASRIKLERFGKPSIVLARCQGSESGPAPDQSSYEALFQSATAIVANYRRLLGARSTVPDELARVTAYGASKPPAATGHKSAAKPKKQAN
jgi:hypothetical protein